MNFKTRIASLSACAAAFFALSAHAQQSAPSPAASAVTIPPLKCDKPGDSPGIDPTQAQIKRFQKAIEEYKLCVNEYARELGSKSNEYADQARAYAAAANGAIDDYNTYVTTLNAKAKGETGERRQGPPSGNKPKY